VNVIHDERAVRVEIAAKRAILSLHEHHRDRIVLRALNQRTHRRETFLRRGDASPATG
jgi:hypothetical protein